MEAKEVTVNYGVTKNMGNYESLRLDYAVRATIEEGELVSEALFKARSVLRGMVEVAVKEEIEYLHGSKPKRR